MKRDQSFLDHVVDWMDGIPGIASRAMFGGWGIYKDGLIFAIIADGELYFKVGDENRAYFERAGSYPFVYAQGKHKSTTMSYWLVPEDVMEDRDELRVWIDRSVNVSRRNEKPPKRCP